MIYSRDLLPGQRFNHGDILQSATMNVRVMFWSGGMLTLWLIDSGSVPLDISQAQWPTLIWSSKTESDALGCIMQTDGNLVIYDQAGHAVWATNTSGHPGAFLRCQDDGNLVIYAPNGSPLWSTNTYASPRGGPLFGAVMIPPPPPPAQRVWWAWPGFSPDDTPTIYGTGFPSDACTVQVQGSGFIHTMNFSGNIATGITVSTPCANDGQICQVTIWTDADPDTKYNFPLPCFVNN